MRPFHGSRNVNQTSDTVHLVMWTFNRNTGLKFSCTGGSQEYKAGLTKDIYGQSQRTLSVSKILVTRCQLGLRYCPDTEPDTGDKAVWNMVKESSQHWDVRALDLVKPRTISETNLSVTGCQPDI